MGNSAAGSGWFFSEEAYLVLLRLHDVRCLGVGPGEEVSGIVNLGADSPGVACVRKDDPVTIPAGAGTTLTVDFQVGRDPGGRGFLGSVVLPLEHIARRCGGSLYHMWLPLDSAQQPAQGASQQGASGSDAQTLEQFDRALRSAARDPRCPLVCLSLCQADSPQAERERYEFNAEASEKGLRFYSLLQSHAQHSRLLQALYRQSRSGRPATSEADKASQVLPGLRDALIDSWASVAQPARSFSRPDSFNPELPTAFEAPGAEGGLADAAAGQFEDPARLRLDIETTTREANARINQASEAIRTLKERLGSKQAEHERLQRETARVRRDADALENENEQLRLQLERRAREQGSPIDRDEELRRLRREAGVLGEQKEALVLILEDLYGAVRPRPSPGSVAAAAPAGAAPAAAAAPADFFASSGPAAGPPEPEEPAGETWTNMLPRPSELFASGVLGPE